MSKGFITHRCPSMPDGWSLRRYEPNGMKWQYPEPNGWVLGHREWDSEWDAVYLDSLTPHRRSFVKFCPWCGEKLEVER